jgi:hypothetical protein
MTSKTDFSDEEWTRLKRAPFVAGMAISLADPGGPIEAFKETSATLKAVLAAAEGGDRGELVGAIARDVRDQARERKSPLAGFRPSKGATAGVEILDELGEVGRLVSEKATPEEAAAVRAWLLAVAQEAADAAKEGGCMGFHAERVSEGEQRMLDQLARALATPSPGPAPAAAASGAARGTSPCPWPDHLHDACFDREAGDGGEKGPVGPGHRALAARRATRGGARTSGEPGCATAHVLPLKGGARMLEAESERRGDDETPCVKPCSD